MRYSKSEYKNRVAICCYLFHEKHRIIRTVSSDCSGKKIATFYINLVEYRTLPRSVQDFVNTKCLCALCGKSPDFNSFLCECGAVTATGEDAFVLVVTNNNIEEFDIEMKKYYELKRKTARLKRVRFSEGFHSKDDLMNLLDAQQDKCFFCMSDLNKRNRSIDHLEPLSTEGTNWPNNIVWVCKSCNSRKGTRNERQFFSEVYKNIGKEKSAIRTKHLKEYRKVKKSLTVEIVKTREDFVKDVENALNDVVFNLLEKQFNDRKKLGSCPVIAYENGGKIVITINEAEISVKSPNPNSTNEWLSGNKAAFGEILVKLELLSVSTIT